ncbi:MAG: MBL fold metallo-hydrolase [Fimbriimonadaceae bacterium]|nr:MBL fold metallo-hydrolase [Fimbriimonadaceae bacterium]
MILKRFYETRLAQASYLVACAATGEAIVIDPNRGFDTYLEAAEEEGVRIVAVTETHIHADFLSGSRELAKLTGATLYLSDEGDAEWKYGFGENVRLVHDGDAFMIGNLKFEVVHTPGHTPEHIAFLVTDTPAGETVQSAFTGDFVFVGDVGRPDLLERAAGYEGTMEAGARRLFRSLEKFKSLPDGLLIWPAHGAGSACGKALGGVPVSTLGYEKRVNWALRIEDEQVFVNEVLAGQPEPPRYFAQMKVRNKVGPALRSDRPAPSHLGAHRLTELVEQGAIVVDARPSAEFAAGHVPGTLSIPLGKGFTNWAGWFVPYDTPFYLIAMGEAEAHEATNALAMIGLDEVAGWFAPTAVRAWAEETGRPLRVVTQIDCHDLMAEADRVQVIDVRGQTEWDDGRLPFAQHRFLGTLGKNLDDLDRERPVVVQCHSGGRSAVGCSLLLNAGFRDVRNLAGGITAYREAGYPVTGP